MSRCLTVNATLAVALFFGAHFALAAPPTNDELAGHLDDFITHALALDTGPGLAVAVVRGDELLYLAGHGLADREADRPATPDTAFYIASSTKSFTGLAAAILAHRGELDLHAPLRDFLPDVEFHSGIDPDRVTLHTLLTHTHGISNGGPITFRCAYSGQHTHELLQQLIPYHPPQPGGPKFEYGNIGYNVASLALDARLEIPWKDLLDREIFQPLGMTNTTGYVSSVPMDRRAIPYRMDPDGFSRQPYDKTDDNMHAAGGLVTTARDLARWLEANLTQGRIGENQVLPAAAFELAHKSHAEQDASFGVFRRLGYGLGWNIGAYDDDVFIHHFGGFNGFHSHIGFLPEHDLGIAVVVNSGAGGGLAASTARLAYDLLLEKDDPQAIADEAHRRIRLQTRGARRSIAADRARRAARPQDLPRPLADYTGTFECFELGRATLRLVDGQLHATLGPLQSDVEVFDNTRHALRVEFAGAGSVVVCHFDGPGPATSVETGGVTFTRVDDAKE